MSKLDSLDRQFAEILWKFHNDRLKDPSITEMKPYIDELRAEVDKARREERTKNLPTTKMEIATYLGISRPTLDRWIENPERMTVGSMKKTLELESHLNTQESEDTDE